MSILANPFRYFIVPTNDQMHIGHTIGTYGLSNKHEIVIDFLNELEEKNKVEVDYRNNEYLLYLISSNSDRFYLLKLAKKKLIDLHIAGDEDVEDMRTPDYPYVYVLIDTKYQLALIEYKSTVFSNTLGTSRILSAILSNFSREHHFDITLNPMLINDHFWKAIRSSEKIIEAEFALESPNLFDGVIDIEKHLKDIKDKYNNVKSVFKLCNESGSLRLEDTNEELNSTLDYIGNGGGQWKLKVIEGGKPETKESSDHVQKILFEDIIEDEMISDSEKIESYIDQVEDVMKNEEIGN